jgi:proteasome lid subunit RPN8/RPN11
VSVEVDLYRTDDYVPAGQIPFGPLLNAALEPVVGDDLEHCRIRLSFLPLADEQELGGWPAVVNLRAECGYVLVQVSRGDAVVYRHPHTVREIVGRPLQRVLAERFPDEPHWGFGLRGPGLEKFAMVRPAPRVRNEVSLGGPAPRRARFRVEEVPEDDPPARTLDELGIRGGAPRPDEPVGVVVRDDVFESLTRSAPFSDKVEEGGFLLGSVYTDGEHPGRRLVEITTAAQAERTGASLLHFTFTGESFLRISEQIIRRGLGEQLVGWYHTHLFPATDAFGLSSIDVSLHHSTFRRPWQIAALVNLSDEGRVLRFFRPSADDMALTAYWVAGNDGG